MNVTPPRVHGGSGHWLRAWPGSRPPRSRLVCLPHAGGGPAAFQGWRARLPADTDLLVAHLPGRETRLAEPPPTDTALVLAELASAIGPGPPVALFGHSWGALLALELARRVPRVGHLVVSGAGAPHCPRVMPPISHLPREEFVAELVALGGMPAAVLAHAPLMDLLLPALRADLRLAEASPRTVGTVLACPVTALGADRDPLTTPASLDAWQRYTTGRFRRVDFRGDHFFHISKRDEVLDEVVRVLSELVAG